MSDNEYDFEDAASDFSFSDDDEDVVELESNTNTTPASQSNNNRSSDDLDSLATVGINGTLYYPWTIEEFIENKLLVKLKKLMNGMLTNCSEDELLVLLQVKGWETEEVLNEYFDDREKLYKQCGLPLVGGHNTLKEVSNFTCFVCCDDYDTTWVYSLNCHHTYCINCYHSYIINSLINNSCGGLISCMEPDCKLTIPPRDIGEIYSIIEHEPIKYKILKENPLLLANAKDIVYSKLEYKWCPSTDCNNFAELVGQYNDEEEEKVKESTDISRVPIVSCGDGHEFCFECNFENHLPCPCWLVKRWIKKCNDDSETANWIDANTHGCPKCQSAIEKNGGCNHMTCKKCKFEFCWICFGNWTDHRNDYYSCNKFRSERVEDEQRKNRSKQSLERYLHFYKRFAIHENSMKGDLKTLDQIDNFTKMYMENLRKTGKENLSWNDIQFLPQAMKSLQNGRKVLKWTYCFAYYLGKSNFATIFEGNQDFLNKSVEDLSEVFEQIMNKKNLDKVGSILKNKSKLRNLSELVTSRKHLLIEAARANLSEGLIWFDT
ncbi:E3 ubiquitin-protein ligase dbl4 [Spathaspora sp. JA1]|nr:E3 ubiquitin-protein ligase dbl4 [Spathaspora sp. JA1]